MNEFLAGWFIVKEVGVSRFPHGDNVRQAVDRHTQEISIVAEVFINNAQIHDRPLQRSQTFPDSIFCQFGNTVKPEFLHDFESKYVDRF